MPAIRRLPGRVELAPWRSRRNKRRRASPQGDLSGGRRCHDPMNRKQGANVTSASRFGSHAYGYDPACHPHSASAGRAADLAIQQRVGLLPFGRPRACSGDHHHLAGIRTHLIRAAAQHASFPGGARGRNPALTLPVFARSAWCCCQRRVGVARCCLARAPSGPRIAQRRCWQVMSARWTAGGSSSRFRGEPAACPPPPHGRCRMS